MKKAYLILQNGEVFEGEAFGHEQQTTGEIVFTTAMTGYLETLTDPSYYGQIVLQTFPLIGNYGVIPDDFESAKISLSAYIVKYPCDLPSNFRSIESLDALLKERGVTGLCGIDTRRLTKIITSCGVMNGKITYSPPTEDDRLEAEQFRIKNSVAAVSRTGCTVMGEGRRVVLIDFGAKAGIEQALLKRGCAVIRLSHSTSANEVLSYSPDGIVLSNGPGDPADSANLGIIESLSRLNESGIPILGICLGHQLLALSHGFKTKKLKFGHRGANQPVKDMQTGRVYITCQNHGYAVEADSCSFINVNDGSCEGLDYGNSFSVQFHPEAHGGPLDTAFLFDRFIERMDKYAQR